MPKPILIGQAPGRNTDPSKPLEDRCGRFLAALIGMPFEDYLRRFERVNLLPEFPGKEGKGDLFPMQEARVNAAALMWGRRLNSRPVVFLGRKVAEAFDLPRLTPLHIWTETHRPELRAIFATAVSPHPSGINLWWNDETNRHEARMFYRKLLELCR